MSESNNRTIMLCSCSYHFGDPLCRRGQHFRLLGQRRWARGGQWRRRRGTVTAAMHTDLVVVVALHVLEVAAPDRALSLLLAHQVLVLELHLPNLVLETI